MKKSYLKIYLGVLIFLTLFGGTGCNMSNVRAEKNNVVREATEVPQSKSESVVNNSNSIGSTRTGSVKTDSITAGSVAGTYNYRTVKNGEGYDNSLEVEEKGRGKLGVLLSGSYIYKVDGSESMHEAEGEGDARLVDNKAIADIKDEDDNNCLVTIIFTANQADIKIPDTCRFNITLGGIYKKEASESKAIKASRDGEKSNQHRISYSKLMDFVNDFESHEVGDKYIVTEVSPAKLDKKIPADAEGNTEYKNLFYLEENDDDGYTGNTLLVSKEMVESLDTNAESEPASLRLTAVLVESKGKYDVYRMTFVTKIEGLDKSGRVLWTAEAKQPSKIEFKH